MTRFRAFIRLVLILALAGLCGLSSFVQARETGHLNTIHWIGQAELPPEARQTLSLIQRGGPFPYPHKDGSIFGNFEKHLPIRARDYYREYTVPTPGRKDRGPRRIIAGKGLTGDVATSGEYFYTLDHYRSFRRIREP